MLEAESFLPAGSPAIAMPETRPILRLVRAVRSRMRTNRWAQELTDWLAQVLGSSLVWVAWNKTMPVRLVLGWPLLGLAVAVLTALLARRLARRQPLWRAAARADQTADLHDELTSAFWFTRHPERSDWVEMHLQRAAAQADSLRASALIPLVRPRRLLMPVLLAAALGVMSLAPVPRVFDQLAERLSRLDLSGDPQALEPIAELQEPLVPPERAESDEQRRREEVLLPQLQEQQEGEDALSEPGAQPEEGLQEPDPEGSTEGAEEGDQQGEPGEDQAGQPLQVDNPQDLPADSEGEPAPDPNASQQEGQGESTEDSSAMLPGGEEVFLQEGGQDPQQKELGEEDLGHATREGGTEQELEQGEVETLEVQLQREILAVPELRQEQPTEEEKEEKITRAERSFLEFESVNVPGEFARQELLESEPIPWRYRELVLRYFKALRERDNQQRDERE